VGPYRETNEKHRRLYFADVSCNSALYKKLSEVKGINIWWQWCRLDATPWAVKCTQCGVLGHIKKNCNLAENVKAIQEDGMSKDKCMDCLVQNMLNEGRHPGYRPRDPSHKSNTRECPTYASLTKRRLRLWRKSEANVQGDINTGLNTQNSTGAKDAKMVNQA